MAPKEIIEFYNAGSEKLPDEFVKLIRSIKSVTLKKWFKCFSLGEDSSTFSFEKEYINFVYI